MIRDQDALNYHELGRRGKIEVKPTKPCVTQRDLALAYTPGVAVPCLAIHADPSKVYNYTAKGNLVAVVSNGTAVLGLGDIGPAAGKPVMEGKGVLFKRFADIDVFDLEVDSHDPEDVIKVVKLLEPTFGGINLEDIKAPECFYIEETLKKTSTIPIFHDDQHGTAIISGAAFLNALELVGKDISKVRVVFNGAGAAGIACANLYLSLGVKLENVMLCDSNGVIYKGRTKGMNPYKEKYALDTNLRTLEEALKDADAFVGVSVANVVTKTMVKSMNKNPIIFAMANPDPEITYNDAREARNDVIMATGRSDYPNQVNNVLGFPFIFRGALDAMASQINQEMKIAAVHALANLAKQDVPDEVLQAYGNERISFGREYIIPKPFDPRVLLWEAPAVARAAIESGVARKKLDLDQYPVELEKRLGFSREVVRKIYTVAAQNPKRIVFPEGEEEKVLRACQVIQDEKIGKPILLGNKEVIKKRIQELNLDLREIQIEDPQNSPRLDNYTQEFYQLRRRKGITLREAKVLMSNPNYFGSMMVQQGDADGLISGLIGHYPDTIKPALQIIKMRKNRSVVAGLYMMILDRDIYFFADTTVNIEPSAEQLAEIALGAAEMAQTLNIEPRIAMLSFSNFGSVKHPLTQKVQQATEIIHQRNPKLIIDGEMQADTAVEPETLQRTYPFSRLQEKANILIFPELQSGNIGYKLVQRLGKADAIGPILMGLARPVHVLERGCTVDAIVKMAAIAVLDAQIKDRE